MNELVNITNEIQQCDKKDISKQVMSVCRAITPQFYKSVTIEDVKAERLSIELLTADIDNNTLAEMCKRAVLNYPKARSLNENTYFDLNYILTFYKTAFNFIHCENVVVSNKAEKIWEFYDDVKGILYQKWKEPNGEEKQVAVIQDKQRGHQYSPKDYQMLYDNPDEIII